MIKNGVRAYNLEKWKKYSPKDNNYIEIQSLSSNKGKHPTQKPLDYVAQERLKK